MNILVTNFDRSGENVMLLGATLINADDMEAYFKLRALDFDDVTEVPEHNMQYYLYDPFWLTMKHQQNVIAALCAPA
jgi:hypothetical protein